jgi:hypothetical protein
MNFKEVAAMFLVAFVISVGVWVTIGPPPPEHTKLLFAGRR